MYDNSSSIQEYAKKVYSKLSGKPRLYRESMKRLREIGTLVNNRDLFFQEFKNLIHYWEQNNIILPGSMQIKKK